MKVRKILGIAAGALVGAALLQPAAAAGAGEKVFKKCAGCHKIGEGAKNSVGPVLTGVVGRPAASYEGYKYSKSLQAARDAGLVWDGDTISKWLTDPTGFLRAYLNDPKAKAKMSFRLKKEEDRHAVIEYLASFSQASVEPPADGFCIVNGSDAEHVFATETREGARQLAHLAPGESLCASGSAAADGIVSVFKTEDGFEGCSRIVPRGTAETMYEFAEFDRCRWSSQDG